MRTRGGVWVTAGAGFVAWLALILLPLGLVYAAVVFGPSGGDLPWSAGHFWCMTGRSVLLAAAVAALAVALGYVPGRVLGTTARGRTVLYMLVLASLVLPRHVLYYIWSILISPTTPLGRLLAEQPSEVVRAVALGTTSAVMVLAYWPLAALVLAQGWRNIEGDILRSSLLEAGAWQRLTRVHLPLLARPLAVAFAACGVLVLAEYTTFHLAGVETLGAQLAVVYELTGSATAVARAGWPLLVPAVGVAVMLARRLEDITTQPPLEEPLPVGTWRWSVTATLVALTLAAPVAILLLNMEGRAALMQFWALQWDGLENSMAAAVLAGGLAMLIAAGVLATEQAGRAGRTLAVVMQATVLVAMFLPGSLVGAAILGAMVFLNMQAAMEQAWWVPALGQAARFAGVALVVLRMARDPSDRHFDEMAGVDGAGWWAAWRHVRWPRVWPLVLGGAILVVLLSLTEVPATMLLLPPGVPNFQQRLLNQMHYARDQHVIASCLLLMAVYLAMAVPVVLLAMRRSGRSAVACLALAAMLVGAGGCGGEAGDSTVPQVLGIIGSTGKGPGEFLYPRGIDLDADGNLWVVDRTGRIQHFTPDGRVLGIILLPLTEKGYPTGLTVGPDGNLYVPDTHYHRVLVYDAKGTLLRKFGEFGTGDGQFIYPTDVAVLPDGRILVSEYGGNDRISIWSADGRFLGAFGSPGSGEGQFSRPAALVVDVARRVIYVADACNHRVARYTLAGDLLGYVGSVGTEAGQLRYPYGLALAADGAIVVCEFGNNRVQVFGPDGVSRRRLGGPGREPGQLAYPWGVAADGRRLFVVDSGNNRVQAWER